MFSSPDIMMTKKQHRRIDLALNFALIALVFNMVMPAHAQVANGVTTITTNIQDRSDTNDIAPVPSLPVISDKPILAKKTITVRTSAYSSTKDQTDSDPFTTASGKKVRDGIVAMNGMPFGTKIRIPKYFGDKVFVIEDRMNARYGKKKVDIWMPTRQQAREWGVRTVTIEVL
jgi:3D (Asp-Asp-Asp) domain-containing protein